MSNFYGIAKKLVRWRWKDNSTSQADYTKGIDTEDERNLFDGPLSGSELLGSELIGKPGHHALVLDIDVPAALVPSSTPGHSHLYIDADMKWWQLDNVLRALADAGIVEDGYYMAAIRRKATYVRTPWVPKEPEKVIGQTALALLGEVIQEEAHEGEQGT